jgi:hypothetical protein
MLIVVVMCCSCHQYLKFNKGRSEISFGISLLFHALFLNSFFTSCESNLLLTCLLFDDVIFGCFFEGCFRFEMFE